MIWEQEGTYHEATCTIYQISGVDIWLKGYKMHLVDRDSMVRALDVCQIVQMVQISRYLAQVVPSLVSAVAILQRCSDLGARQHAVALAWPVGASACRGGDLVRRNFFPSV